jgi:hypothetical protein
MNHIDRNDVYRPAALTQEEWEAFCRDMADMAESYGQCCEPDEPPPEWFKTVPF